MTHLSKIWWRRRNTRLSRTEQHIEHWMASCWPWQQPVPSAEGFLLLEQLYGWLDTKMLRGTGTRTEMQCSCRAVSWRWLVEWSRATRRHPVRIAHVYIALHSASELPFLCLWGWCALDGNVASKRLLELAFRYSSLYLILLQRLLDLRTIFMSLRQT